MKKILSKDTPQLTKHHIVAFGLLQIQERIDTIQVSLKNKDGLCKLKEKEKSEVQ
jgi:hypothetical protein